MPDISIWKTEQLKDINNMFDFCDNLIEIPDISRWNIDKVNTIKMDSSFANTSSSLQLSSKDKKDFVSSSMNSERNDSNKESPNNKDYVDTNYLKRNSDIFGSNSNVNNDYYDNFYN